MPYTLQNKKIWVAGHNGMVGSAICRALLNHNCEIITANKADLDLRDQHATNTFMATQKPDAIILAAAKVGGIKANNDEPADFLYDNLMIESNVIHAAYKNQIQKLLFLGSSCIYPRDATQPITEDTLLTAPLEPTNEAYAIAKIAGIKLCQSYRAQYDCDFISAMPCNLYGQNDYYDAQRSHVIPALIMKIHNAKHNGDKNIELWGTGTPLREFLYVDDLAGGLLHLLQNYSEAAPVNIGSSTEISIADLATTIATVIGYNGTISFNPEMPDGTPRKLMDSSKMRAMGWQPQTTLEDGLRKTYEYYCEQESRKYAA